MKSENIQSLVAVSVALFALFISIWQGCEQRHHNRLSVKPILDLEQISYNSNISIRLSNNGLGPAIIEKFLIKTTDGLILDTKDGNPWNRLPIISKVDMSEMYYYQKGATIKPNKSYNLITWKVDSITTLDIELIIDYHSIYEEEFEVSSEF